MSRNLLALLFLSMLANAQAFADIQKFVYVFDVDGTLLLPKNAAEQCPDPSGGVRPGSECRGVKVDADGHYSLKLKTDEITSPENLILISNEYQYIPAKGLKQDSYVLMESKRRVDKIAKDKNNRGVDINNLSEAVVQAIEDASNLPKGKKGTINKHLAEKVNNVKAHELNASLKNCQEDNEESTDAETQWERELRNVQQEKLTEQEQETLLELATVAVANEDNEIALNYIRKNIVQGLEDPEYLQQAAEQVFNHVGDIVSAADGEAILFLEADKYKVYTNESAQLTTDNSINSSKFFAYSWHGVESDKSSAVFTQPDTGSYLVCATGEIDDANASSTDCVRMAVKNIVEAIARASQHRVGTGNQITVSGSLSVGAQSYNWSGPGTFADPTAEETTWTAPDVPGKYEIVLTVNDEETDSVVIDVFDVLPVAIAEADKYVAYLENGKGTFNLSSGSIATDGSAVDRIDWAVIDQPEGSLPALTNTNQIMTQLTADLPGTYVVRHTAFKGEDSDVTELRMQVRMPGAPVADAGPDQVTFRNKPIELDGSQSSATEENSLSYQWSADSGVIEQVNSSIATFSASSIGEYQVKLEVSDGRLTDTDQVTVTVKNQLPVASDAVVANLLNEILVGQLLAIDGDRDSLVYELVSEPVSGGVTIDSETGAYTYMPGGVKGCHYKPYSKPVGNDKGGLDVPVIKLCADKYVVAPGEVVNLTTSNSINASKFSGYTWQNAIPDEQDIRKATFVSGEVGLHEVCVTGNIGQSNNTSTACVEIQVSGDEKAVIDDDIETGYIDKFKFRVSDGFNQSNIATVYITIGWENALPVPDDIAVQTVEDMPVSGTLTATDADGHDLTYKLETNGSLGKAVIDNPNTGAFSYTPNKDANGVDVFTFRVNDGLQDSIAGTVTVNIASTNDVPVAYFAGVLKTDEDVAVDGMLGAVDPDGDVLDFRLATRPKLGNVIINDAQSGAFTYIPNPDANGEDSFFFVVHDGEIESNTAPVSILVAPVNDVPVANSAGPFDIHADEIFTGVLSASDVDKDALVYEIKSNGSKGTAELINPATGEFKYTPDGATLGTDSFTFVAKDAYVDSNVATVTLNILPVNHAPVAQDQSITVFENVAYGGIVQGTDSDGDAITYSIVDKGRLGTAAITNAATGEFTYTPKNARGEDYFTFKASDGEKASKTTTVHIQIIDTSLLCQGPGSFPVDMDGDGYADYVEAAFGISIDSGSSTPNGLNAESLGVSFVDDDDGDGFTDLTELWLQTNYLDPSSIPTQSTLRGLPDCMSALWDAQPSALQAFDILTPIVDAGNGDGVASFALTAIDNAAGVKKVSVRLVSPSGAEVHAQSVIQGNPLVLYTQFSSDPFSQYAEAGTWTVAELKIVDAAGNELVLTTGDLQTRGFPYTLEVVNPNSDPVAPVLTGFEILTPTLDISSGSAVASFRCSVTDNLSGIARIAVTLRSPSGTYRWGEVLREDHATSATEVINTNAIETYMEPGIWQVSELVITDHAGNVLQFNTAEMQTEGLPVEIQVINSHPDTVGPGLDGFDILTPVIYPYVDDAKASFSVTAHDDGAGVKDFALMLQSPSGESVSANYVTVEPVSPLTAQFDSDVLTCQAEPGTYTVQTLHITDGAGNKSTWTTQQLQALDYKVTLTVHSCGGGIGLNHPPVAYADSFETDEDVPFDGSLRATDIDGDSLTYTVVGKPSLGTVSVDAATGVFTYTPNANANGADSFTFKADDGKSESNTATVTIAINPVDDPVLAEDLEITVVQNTTYQDYLRAEDPDGDTLTFNIIDNGGLGTAYFINQHLGTFQFIPNQDVVGEDQFTFIVNDGVSDSEVTTVKVHIVPEVVLTGFQVLTPVVSANDANVLITCAVTLSKPISDIAEARISLTGPSGQVVGFATEVSAGNYPFNISRLIVTSVQPLEPGIWTFNNLLVKKQGAQFSILVEDDIEAAGFNAIVEVADNTSPVAIAGQLTASLSNVKQSILEATDADGDALTYRIVNSGSKGVATLLDASTGVFEYTPNTIGVDTIIFIANDGISDSNLGAVTITINATNGAPIAHDGTITVTENIAYIGKVSAVDPEGDVLVYEIVDKPLHGTVTWSGNASSEFVYRPDPDTVGEDSFTFKANDGSDDSNLATVSVSIVKANGVPAADADTITVFKNVTYSGSLSGSDPEGDDLIYQLVSNGALGTVALNSNTGAFTYTPLTNVVGQDYFTFTVSDGSNTSKSALVTVDIISKEQACGTGGIVTGRDSDGDGYVNEIELAAGTLVDDAESTPAGLSMSDLGISFSDDDDLDGYDDYVEIWKVSNPYDAASVPKYYLADCFNPSSDGIKPQLLGYNIITPQINVSAGENTVSFVLSLLDNASGLKRVRVSLTSPSGVFITESASFSDYPLLHAIQLDVSGIGEFAEPGVWQVSGMTIYDEAGNRLDLGTADLTEAGLPTEIVVTNDNGDVNPPELEGFTILTPDVYPGAGNGRMGVEVSVSDFESGVSSVRVDFISASGIVVSASATLADNPTQATLSLETQILSEYLEQGVWTVYGLLLVDSAGNSVQLADQLYSKGYATTLHVTNPNSDTAAPVLESFSILTPQVYPISSDARMEFSVTASDNAAGIEKFRIDMRGPSGQILSAWASYSANYPLNATAQISSAVLSTQLEEGIWTVETVEVFDDAGNSQLLTTDEMGSLGYPAHVTVSY